MLLLAPDRPRSKQRSRGIKQVSSTDIVYPLSGPITVAAIGDSMTFANQVTSGGTQRTHEGVGYLTNYNMRAMQRMYFPPVNNLGVSGETLAQIEARKTDLASKTFDVCVFLGGANSVTGKVSAASQIASAASIIDYVAGTLGKICVALPQLPRSYWPAFSAGEITQGLADIATYNAYIYSRHGAFGGRVIADTSLFHDNMDDGSGGAIANSTYDLLHPSMYGGALNGDALDTILEPYFGRYVPDFSTAANLLVNGVLAGTGGTAGANATGTVADNFTVTGSGGVGGRTASKPSANVQRIEATTTNATTTDSHRMSQTITQASGKFDVGDTLYAQVLVEVLASPTPVRITQTGLQCRLTGTGLPTLINCFGNDRRGTPDFIGEVYGLTPGLLLVETPDLPITSGSGMSCEFRFEGQGDSASGNTETATYEIRGAAIYKR